jgi:endonuclease IV
MFSIKDGFSGAVMEALKIRANAFAIFTASRLSWTKKAMDADAAIKFKETCAKYNFPPHSIGNSSSFAYIIRLKCLMEVT